MENDPFAISTDDDNTIKEMLAKIAPSPAMNPIQRPSSRQQDTINLSPRPTKSASHQAPLPSHMFQPKYEPERPEPLINLEPERELKESHVDVFARIYSSHIRLISVLFIIFFICYFLPISMFVQKYLFACHLIPFSDPFIRAALASTLSYICLILLAWR